MADWGLDPKDSICSSLDEVNLKLRETIENANNSSTPQLISIKLNLGPDLIFEIPNEFFEVSSSVEQLATANEIETIASPASKKRRILETSEIETGFQQMTVLESLENMPEKKPIPVHREIARLIIAAVSEIDGYGWRNYNTFRAKDGWRLEYICIDSYQNQHRASNKTRRGVAQKEDTPNSKPDKNRGKKAH